MVTIQKIFLTNLLFSETLKGISNPLNLFDMGFFQSSGGGGGGHEVPHHNFVVIPPMIMKFGTGIKLDVL